MYTSGIHKSATKDPAGTSGNWRRRVADVDVVKKQDLQTPRLAVAALWRLKDGGGE